LSGTGQAIEPGLYDGDFILDLAKRFAEIIARPSLKIEGQSLPMQQEIFEPLAFVQLDIRVDDSLNCVRHCGLLQRKSRRALRRRPFRATAGSISGAVAIYAKPASA
jgi:hypothetical protein